MVNFFLLLHTIVDLVLYVHKIVESPLHNRVYNIRVCTIVKL